jgi:hypothetical protein
LKQSTSSRRTTNAITCWAHTVRRKNWVCSLSPVYFRSNLTISFHLRLGLSSGILRLCLRFRVLILLSPPPFALVAPYFQSIRSLFWNTADHVCRSLWETSSQPYQHQLKV